jgi:hypothetical protein
MTISEILSRDSSQLKSITNEQWEKELSHYFNVTRPEYARKAGQTQLTYISPEKKAVFNSVKEKTGIDLAQMMRDLNVGKKKK